MPKGSVRSTAFGCCLTAEQKPILPLCPHLFLPLFRDKLKAIYHQENYKMGENTMHQICEAARLAEKIYRMTVEAPFVARSCEPGDFLIVKLDERGERIPLTVVDFDRAAGTVDIIFQVVGATTLRMARLQAGDAFQDVVGPLGNPSDFVKEPLETVKGQRYCFIGGGVGAAPVYPQVKWFAEHGIDCDVIIGTRSHDTLILEEEFKALTDNVHVCTDDGSYGVHGNVCVVLEDLVKKQGKQYDRVVAIGPMIMMKFVSALTKELQIPTTVSMNPIMVDGTGMCGACRLQVGDEVKFACVDGPEFDGHQVNFDEAMKRQQMYKTEEGRALLRLHEGATHHGGCGNCGGDK